MCIQYTIPSGSIASKDSIYSYLSLMKISNCMHVKTIDQWKEKRLDYLDTVNIHLEQSDSKLNKLLETKSQSLLTRRVTTLRWWKLNFSHRKDFVISLQHWHWYKSSQDTRLLQQTMHHHIELLTIQGKEHNDSAIAIWHKEIRV